MHNCHFPKDTQMLFCIGAQKAGTTWLFHLLRQSKHIHFSKSKELHYFDVIHGKAKQLHDARVHAIQMLASKLSTNIGSHNDTHLDSMIETAKLLKIYSNDDGHHHGYISYLLQRYARQDVVADITPAYAILDREIFAEMGRIGCAKFIFIMRDPVDRMWSQIRMAVRSQNPEPKMFQHNCEARARHLITTNRLFKIERANYQRTINELESVIPKDRIKYIFYENLFLESTIFDICQFIGIPTLSAQFEMRQNEGIPALLPEDVELEFRRALHPQYTFAYEKFGAAMPPSWNKEFKQQLSYKHSTLTT